MTVGIRKIVKSLHTLFFFLVSEIRDGLDKIIDLGHSGLKAQ